MSSDTQVVACYCPIWIVTVSTHSLCLLTTYIIPYQFSVVPREKSRMRLGSKPWLTSQHKGLVLGGGASCDGVMLLDGITPA